MKKIIGSIIIVLVLLGSAQAFDIKTFSPSVQSIYNQMESDEQFLFRYLSSVANSAHSRVTKLEKELAEQKEFNTKIIKVLKLYGDQIEANSMQFHSKYNF